MLSTIFSSKKQSGLLPMTHDEAQNQSSSSSSSYTVITSYLSTITTYINQSCQFTFKKASSIAGSVVKFGRQMSTDTLPTTHQDTQKPFRAQSPQAPTTTPIVPVNPADSSKPFNQETGPLISTFQPFTPTTTAPSASNYQSSFRQHF